MRHALIRLCPLVLVTVFSLTASRGSAATFVVRMGNFFFTPTNPVINVGDSVRWTNSSSFPHDTTAGGSAPPFDNRLWTSPLMAQSDPAFTFTFSNAGYYPYICKVHVVDGVPPQPQQTGTVTVTTGNLPPTCHVTSPLNNTRFTNVANLTVAANAADTNGAVSHVDFFLGGSPLARDSAPPYSAILSNVPVGTNFILAVATDNLGLSTTSAVISVVVTNFATTNTVTIQNLAFSPQVITVAAGSTVIWRNQEGAISHTSTGETNSLEPLCGAAVLAPTRSCTNRFFTPGVWPYYCTIHPSMLGTVVVARVASTPMVNLISPSDGSTFAPGALIAFEAGASDANGIASVQFFHSGNVSLGADTSAPYSVSSSLAAGHYSIFAKATDSLGFGALTPQNSFSVVSFVPLELLGPAQGLDGALQFDMTTTPGVSYVVQQTPALPAGWSNLLSLTATGSVTRFTEPPPFSPTQKFFRAFIQP